MGYVREFEKCAINKVYENALKNEFYQRKFIDNILEKYNIDANSIIKKMLSKKITINFHPDRMLDNGFLVIEGLIKEGKYLNQFHTGTTNGGKTAYIGGDRFSWEQRLFSNIYPEETLNRPKYGALNLLNYIDGAAARFGSCYFTLKSSALSQCTFAYGDSSNNPDIMGTSKSFYGILYSLLSEVIKNNKFLNIDNCSTSDAIKLLLKDDNLEGKTGHNLNYYIEAHIHGDILLSEDIECMYLDESFKNTRIYDCAKVLSDKYSIKLNWIPKREVKIDDIDEEFRGEIMKPISKRINSMFGENSGYIDTSQLGKASCSSIVSQDVWMDIGSKDELFQYFKQVWHILAFYG